MFNLFKKRPQLTEAEKLALRKKEAVFNEIKKWPIGTKMSNEDMKEYIQALCNYRSWIKTVYIEMSLIRFREFILLEIDLENIPLPDNVCSIIKENHLNSLKKISHYKKLVKKTNWIPPIIFDYENKTIVDGAHRAEALKELGIKKIPCFVGVEYLTLENLNRVLPKMK